MMSFLKQNILAVSLVGILVLGGVWYVFSGDSTDDTVLTTESVSDAPSVVEKGIVDILLTLRSVSLSGTIFSDPAFDTLQDFGTQIIEEPFGRPNPFAPREEGSGVEDSDAELFSPQR